MKPRDSRRAVGQGIRLRLRIAGQTQAALAKHIGRRPSTLSLKLDGKSTFNTDELDAIAEFLGIDVSEIFTVPTVTIAA